MPDRIIRKMTAEDIPQVAALERECFSQPWSEQSLQDSLKKGDDIFLAAEQQGKILGYVGMYISYDEGEITNVCVSHNARRQGIGKDLMLSVQREASKRQLCSIFLEVRISNAAAIALYEGLGYEQIALRKGMYDFPKEDGYLMRLKL